MYNTDLPTRAELPSTRRLLRSTALAASIAAGLLVTTILPAEYGVDPTGIGGALGLTRMGEIKLSLAREAEASVAPPASAGFLLPSSQPAAATPAPPDDHGHGLGQGHEHAKAAAPQAAQRGTENRVAAAAVAGREHTVTIRLKPGEAAEIKLSMQKDASVHYQWSAAGGTVNFDTHGDPVKAPKGFYHGYGKGRNESAQAGTLQAAFDGKHGWFWRNRSGGEVTLTLKTRGDYGQIERVL